MEKEYIDSQRDSLNEKNVEIFTVAPVTQSVECYAYDVKVGDSSSPRRIFFICFKLSKLN